MTIALVVNRWAPVFERTGGEKRGARLLDAMQRAGLEPHILTTESPDPVSAEAAQQRGWTLHALGGAPRTLRTRAVLHLRGEIARSSPALAGRLAELAEQAAFVQLEEIGAFQYQRFVPSGVPTIASTYNVDSVARFNGEDQRRSLRVELRRRRMARLEMRTAQLATATLCVSDADCRHFDGAGTTVCVPNGVDDALFEIPDARETGEQVLFFGTFSYRPNLEGILRFLSKSWPQISAAAPAARLRIAGSRPPHALVEMADATDGVEVLGFVDDLADELRRARLVVAPVWWGGGTRIKVLEAMAAGRAVVGPAFAVEQIGFESGDHGVTAESDEALALAVLELLDDATRATSLGIEARRLADRFRWRSVLAPAERLYQDLARSWTDAR